MLFFTSFVIIIFSMEIKLYNSLTKKVELFKPIKENEVSMYVCGPTVYNYPHIGNLRPVVVFDTLRRFLSYIGYKVTYVSNFTDIDDKIINKAIAENKSELEISSFFIDEFKKEIHQIGSLDPDITPRVSDYINQIIDYIDRLIKKGAAYVSDGEVFFRVTSDKDYGLLSKIELDELIQGARVETSSKKENPLDFVLWKKTDVGIKFDSPWSKGRPGWHTECCVMIDSIFKDNDGLIDIHGGGYDLKFPHHENEIAQSNALHNHHLANYWIHNNFVNINNEKMSKSLGNVFLAKDLINQYGGTVIRMVMLSVPYRQPINFSEESIKSATNELNKIKNVYKQLASTLQVNKVVLDGKQLKIDKSYMDNFLDSLSQDLNIPNALSVLYDIMKQANICLRETAPDLDELTTYFYTIKDMLSILGLNIDYPILDSEDIALYGTYLNAKKARDYALSDNIRSKLLEKGIL